MAIYFAMRGRRRGADIIIRSMVGVRAIPAAVEFSALIPGRPTNKRHRLDALHACVRLQAWSVGTVSRIAW